MKLPCIEVLYTLTGALRSERLAAITVAATGRIFLEPCVRVSHCLTCLTTFDSCHISASGITAADIQSTGCSVAVTTDCHVGRIRLWRRGRRRLPINCKHKDKDDLPALENSWQDVKLFIVCKSDGDCVIDDKPKCGSLSVNDEDDVVAQSFQYDVSSKGARNKLYLCVRARMIVYW